MFLKQKKLIFRQKKLLSVNSFENKKRVSKKKKQKFEKKFWIKCLKLELHSNNNKECKKKVNVLDTSYDNSGKRKARDNKGLFKYFIRKFRFFNKSWRYRAANEQKRYPKEDLGVLFLNLFDTKVFEEKNGFIFSSVQGKHQVRQYIFVYFLNNLIKKLNYNDYLLS